ncbi:hypothetical protein GQ457_08G017150 [Hibiscus cannabinus]
MKHGMEGDVEAVRKAPKVLTPYMNFYITQCKGVKLEGGKMKMTNSSRKALGLRWAQMTHEEKKPYV